MMPVTVARMGDAIEACLPLVALAISLLLAWGCM